MKTFTPKMLILIIVSILTFIGAVLGAVLLFVFNLIPIYKFIIPIFFVLFAVLALIWVVWGIWRFVKNIIFKRLLIIFFIVIPIILSALVAPYALLLTNIAGKPYYTSSSLDRKNTVIVFEGGFIDASYTAYPVKYHFFYQKQDNGFVSRHDCWGGAEIDIEWISNNEAHVKVIIDGYSIPNANSNADDIIIVKI